jgi:hypothetical protein
MTKWLIGCIAAILLASPLSAAAAPSAAEAGAVEATTEGSSAVQQGLTIHELDKELLRLKEQEAVVVEKIGQQEETLESQAVSLKQRSAAAGKILRAYYMGERDRLWMLLFEMRSLSEALLALDYLQSIVSNDFRTLETYRAAYQEQQVLLAELESKQTNLEYIIAEHERQRERLLTAQEELDRKLAALSEAEHLAELEKIAAVTTEWEDVGIPIFESVLSALSAAMVDLPMLLSDQSLLEMNGTNVQIRITDDRFNRFLREHNALFDKFEFKFVEQGLTVTGKVEEKIASFEGQYILQKEPVNALRFEITRIVFNGYELPDTTRNSLHKQYDFTFEPGKLFAGLSVADLANEEGQLRVQLTFDSLSFIRKDE